MRAQLGRQAQDHVLPSRWEICLEQIKSQAWCLAVPVLSGFRQAWLDSLSEQAQQSVPCQCIARSNYAAGDPSNQTRHGRDDMQICLSCRLLAYCWTSSALAAVLSGC